VQTIVGRRPYASVHKDDLFKAFKEKAELRWVAVLGYHVIDRKRLISFE